jgi:RNA 3'-terminal phosphate cyclase (ATP)
MIEIDGSYGEGGGQVLRTALSLSCVLRKPFRIVNIRKNRKKPGLMPQHLASIRAACGVSSAEVTGDCQGSTELCFFPGETRSGLFSFDIGTAGSVTLVLQTILPPLLLANGTSAVTLQGGTHVPFSPSFNYLSEVFAPFLRGLGGEVRLSIDSYGFYPRGGGRIRAEIFPAGGFQSQNLTERGRLLRVTGCSAVGNLPISIAERQRMAALEFIEGRMTTIWCPMEVKLLDVPTSGQGTFLFLKAETEYSLAGFTALGERGKRAERVGEEAAGEFLRYMAEDAFFEPHLSDQAVLYLALAGKRASFSSSGITRHLLTNLWVINLFQPFSYAVEGETGKPGKVTIH